MVANREATGIVLKNDVNARGSFVCKDGTIRKKKCCICEQDIGDLETVYYVFRLRGTMSAQSKYIHIQCEPQCRIPSATNKRTRCRICNSNKHLDGRMPPGIFYHSSCLCKVKREIVPIKELKKKVVKRAEGRFKRARLYYFIPTDPYEEIKLYLRHKWDGKGVLVTVRALDGKLIEVRYKNLYLFSSGHWRKIYSQQLTEDEELFLKVQKDLQRYYDKRGRPVGERLDTDYKLRFLLKHGTSMEGVINEVIEE